MSLGLRASEGGLSLRKYVLSESIRFGGEIGARPLADAAPCSDLNVLPFDCYPRVFQAHTRDTRTLMSLLGRLSSNPATHTDAEVALQVYRGDDLPQDAVSVERSFATDPYRW